MYTIHGALASPYSVKMRALMRYRRIPHILVHGAGSHHLLSKVKAKVIPVMEYPDGSFHNDSTVLIYDLEARHYERSVIPTDPARAFVAHLLEDFADEWVAKAMFSYRWLREVDQEQMSRWLAFDAMKGGGLEAILGFAQQIRDRQVDRMAFVGCTEENLALIESTNRRLLAALEAHVVDRHCLFGTRPSLAEFSLYGQLSQMGIDPTAQTMMRKDFPYSYRWLSHIDDMSGIEGEWDAPDVPYGPIVHEMLAIAGQVYAPFLLANARAAEAREARFSFTVDGMPYEQATFGYQVKCLADLRSRYAALPDAVQAELDPLFQSTNLGELLS